jgi:hypothetical protein
MLDSGGSEKGGVCENIYEFFDFYNCAPYLLVPELLLVWGLLWRYTVSSGKTFRAVVTTRLRNVGNYFQLDAV